MCLNIEHGTLPLDHQFHHEVVPNFAQLNGVKRFPALETRFCYQLDTPYSPSGAGTSVEMSKPMEAVQSWKGREGVGVNKYFNALMMKKMVASDCHQLQKRLRLTTPFFSKGE